MAVFDLAKGEWSECFKKIEQIDIWSKIANSTHILGLLKSKVKEQALKCFLFSMGRTLHTLKFSMLSSLFDLDVSAIKKILFSVIVKGQLNARVNAAEDSIVFTNSDSYSLQSVAVELSQKLSTVV